MDPHGNVEARPVKRCIACGAAVPDEAVLNM
jgi:hypothetical protein